MNLEKWLLILHVILWLDCPSAGAQSRSNQGEGERQVHFEELRPTQSEVGRENVTAMMVSWAKASNGDHDAFGRQINGFAKKGGTHL